MCVTFYTVNKVEIIFIHILSKSDHGCGTVGPK